MSQNVTIGEGGRDFRFASVKRIVTEYDEEQSGGSGGVTTDDWVAIADRPMQKKYLSKNGTYYASDEDLYAFSKITVNVTGGGTGSTVPTKTGIYGEIPNQDMQSTDIPQTIGGIGGNAPDYGMPNGFGLDGNALYGVNPSTGNMSVARLDSSGNVGITPIPDHISVLTPPAKLDYTEGERIQYAGLTVELLKTDGTTFKDADYPDGILVWSPTKWNPMYLRPMQNLNLVTEMENAPEISSGGKEGRVSDFEDVRQFMPIMYPTRTARLHYKGGTEGTDRYRTWTSSGVDAVIFGMPDGSTSRSYSVFFIYLWESHSDQAFVHDGKGVDWFFAPKITDGYGAQIYVDGPCVEYIAKGSYANNYGLTYDQINHIAWTAIHGREYSDTQSVPVGVSWECPFNGLTLETTFDITVTKAEGEQEESESGTGGGGGGHAF